MDYQCCEQLTEMRLNAMKDEYKRQSELPAAADQSFDERFVLVVQAQYNQRKSNAISRTLKRLSSGNHQRTWLILTSAPKGTFLRIRLSSYPKCHG